MEIQLWLFITLLYVVDCATTDVDLNELVSLRQNLVAKDTRKSHHYKTSLHVYIGTIYSTPTQIEQKLVVWANTCGSGYFWLALKRHRTRRQARGLSGD